MTLDEPKRPAGCLTDLALDRWFSGELADDARATADAHLGTCTRCRERHQALSAERDVFLALRPWSEPPSGRARPAGARRWAAATGALVLAAALALLVRSRPPEATVERGDGVRLKGTPRIGFYVERPEGAQRGARGQGVHPGDRIRFTYTGDKTLYLAVYGRDASGTTSVYFPPGAHAEPMTPGTDVPVASTVELDDVLGRERIVAVLCDSEFQVSELRDHVAPEAPPGCRLDAFEWEKKAAAR